MNIAERPKRMELEQEPLSEEQIKALDDERRAHVAKGKDVIGGFEEHLHAAIGIAQVGVVEWCLEAYRLRIIEGTECMSLISQAGVMGGDLSAVALKVYPAHAGMTAKAKEQGIDVPGPYAVLADIKRVPGPRSGGDR